MGFYGGHSPAAAAHPDGDVGRPRKWFCVLEPELTCLTFMTPIDCHSLGGLRGVMVRKECHPVREEWPKPVELAGLQLLSCPSFEHGVLGSLPPAPSTEPDRSMGFRVRGLPSPVPTPGDLVALSSSPDIPTRQILLKIFFSFTAFKKRA